MRKYGVKTPFISHASFEYDEVTIKILDDSFKEKEFLISLDLLNDNILVIKPLYKNYCDYYQIVDNELYINTRIYKNSDKKIMLKKYYTNNSKYNYSYSNNFLNTKITLEVKDKEKFKESSLIKTLMESSVLDISKLWQEISNIIGNNLNSIFIKNEKEFNNIEKIVIDNNTLIEYKRLIKHENGKFEYLNYRDGTLYITKSENPSENEELNKIKKLLKEIR